MKATLTVLGMTGVLLLALPASGDVGLAGLPGIQGLTVYERTGTGLTHSFGLGQPTSQALLNQIPGGPSTTSYDFLGTSTEFYDVYLSDADGLGNPQGEYLSIACYRDADLTNGHTGNNIDSVELLLSSGPSFYADHVGSVQLGTGLWGDYVTYNGFIDHALGPPNTTMTAMGDHYSRMTLGFKAAMVGAPVAPVREVAGQEPTYHDYALSLSTTYDLRPDVEAKLDFSPFFMVNIHQEVPFQVRANEHFELSKEWRFSYLEGSLLDKAFSSLVGTISDTRSFTVGISGEVLVGGFIEIAEGDENAEFSIDAGVDPGFTGELDLGTVANALPPVAVAYRYLPAGFRDFLEKSSVRFPLEPAGASGGITLPLPEDWDGEPGIYGVGIHGVLGASLETEITHEFSILDVTGQPQTGPTLAESLGSYLGLPENPYVTSDTGTAGFDGNVCRMETGSPVWLTSVVDVDELTNALIFDALFTSEEGAEGLLAIYWDGVLVGTIDERVAPDYLNSYILSLGDDFEPGTYTISFRLDPYTDVTSSVEISNVSGFYAVPEPATLGLLALGSMALLRRRCAA